MHLTRNIEEGAGDIKGGGEFRRGCGWLLMKWINVRRRNKRILDRVYIKSCYAPKNDVWVSNLTPYFNSLYQFLFQNNRLFFYASSDYLFFMLIQLCTWH
jgi:hypothetical protein